MKDKILKEFENLLEEFKDFYRTKNFIVATILTIFWSVCILAVLIALLAIFLDILGIV